MSKTLINMSSRRVDWCQLHIFHSNIKIQPQTLIPSWDEVTEFTFLYGHKKSGGTAESLPVLDCQPEVIPSSLETWNGCNCTVDVLHLQRARPTVRDQRKRFWLNSFRFLSKVKTKCFTVALEQILGMKEIHVLEATGGLFTSNKRAKTSSLLRNYQGWLTKWVFYLLQVGTKPLTWSMLLHSTNNNNFLKTRSINLHANYLRENGFRRKTERSHQKITVDDLDSYRGDQISFLISTP